MDGKVEIIQKLKKKYFKKVLFKYGIQTFVMQAKNGWDAITAEAL